MRNSWKNIAHLIFRINGIIVCCIVLCSTSLCAQTYPVQANLSITPPYSVYLSDYTTLGSTKLNVNVYLADLSRASVDISFRLIIEGAGVELRTKQEFVGTRQTIYSGVPSQFFGDQLTEYFNLNNLDIIGLSRSQLESTGALPEGVYRFTLEVLEYNRGVKISNSATSIVWLILNDPPLLNLPLDTEIITASDPQIVRFQWTPRHKGSPNASFNTEYLLKIVEIWPETRNPNDAILTSNPVFEATTTANYFVYSVANPALIPGRKYAFTVQARAISGTDELDLFKNNGFSQVRSFQFGNACNPPSKVDLLETKNKSIEIGWDIPDGATGFNIMYREKDNKANWFEKFSYLPNLSIHQLQPNKNYEVMVKANCLTISSEFTEPYEFQTANAINEFTCGDLDIRYDLSNRSPIPSLFVGETVLAGDFEIELISVSRTMRGYSGTGLINLPFLNMAKTLVSYESLRVNTDYRVYDGSLTTLYDEDSRMIYQPDEPGNDVGTENPPVYPSDTTEIMPADSSVLPVNPMEPIPVDTIFVDDNGDIVAVIDNKEVVLDPNNDNGEQYVDSNGNTYMVSNNGLSQSNSSGATNTPSVAAGATSGNEYQFGPLKLILKEALPEAANENCYYDGLEAQIELTIEDLDLEISENIKLNSSNINIQKNCETGEIISGSINWENQGDPFHFSLYEFEVEVNKLSIEIDSSGIINGNVELRGYVDQDKALNQITVLKNGAEGKISYRLVREENELKSAFDFSDIKNISIEIIKQQKLIGKLTNGRFTSGGFVEGKIQLASAVDYTSNGFSVRLTKLNLDVRYGLGKAFQLKQGSATAIISNNSLIKGDVKIDIEVLDNQTSAILENAKLEAFGMELSDLNLKVEIDSRLNVTGISGSASAYHPQFGARIDVRNISVSNGQLEELNLSGEILYQNLNITIHDAAVNINDKQLIIDAFVELEQEGIQIAAQISDFRINTDGTIVWGGYDLSFDGVKTFGPLTVALSGESGASSGTWRETTATASLTMEISGKEDPISISNANISFKKHRSKDRYKDVVVSLEEANLNVDLGMLETTLSEMNIALESPDYIEGDGSNAADIQIAQNSYLKFEVSLENDLELRNLLFVQKGVTGSITYSFTGEMLDGELDFSDVQNLNVVARKGGQVLASLVNGEISEEGILMGNVSVLPNASFNTNGFSVQVIAMNYHVEVPINNTTRKFKMHSGRGSLGLSGDGAVEGSIIIDYEFDNQQNTVCSVNNATDISVYNLQLRDLDLKAELNQNLEPTEITGHMHAEHEDFDSYLKVSEFSIKNGKLIDFDVEGDVKFKGFNLKINKADFSNDLLLLDGEVAINITGTSAWLAIEEMTIDPDGVISVKGIEGQLDKSPILIGFSANMEEARFKGSFTGELAEVGLSGSIDIGVQDDAYNFAYLELKAQGNVPLPGTGLKLTQLGGQFGYNYKLIYSNPNDKPEGNPQEGNYVVGLLIGVADAANLVEVAGNTVVQFGNDQFELNLNGSINIPKEKTIAQGKVNIQYTLPDNTLAGGVALDLAVPPSNGRLIAANFDMNYLRANQKWSLSSTDISAKLFSEIDFVGNLELNGSDEKTNINGILSGHASYAFKYFNEGEILGAKVLTNLDAGFNFNGEIAFDDNGANGEISLYLYTNGEVGVELEVGEYTKLVAISGSSLSQLSITPTQAKVYGNLDVTLYILGLEHEMELEIDHTI